MEDSTILKSITYDYIINLTKFFLEKYNKKEIKSLQQVLDIVCRRVPDIKDFAYIFDETIWVPDRPEWYKNLIEFKVAIGNSIEILPFRLKVDGGYEQKPIMLIPGTMMWENPVEWVEVFECPKCHSTNIKWHLSSTKECKDCGEVFRAEELINV